ncbi:MAG: 4a-hydroxytetrahydrobiopterin dehydratase [Planctomycetes bacterium]|nr:4a-hydroxytetrahydrobiopterin dehydratase [Planctomycetota bacterium]
MAPPTTSRAGDPADRPLSADEIAAAMSDLTGWSGDLAALSRSYRFPTFLDAMAFLADGAHAADRLGHHPDWRNVYDRVDIRLSTHDAGDRVTAKDVELARLLDGHARRHGGR